MAALVLVADRFGLLESWRDLPPAAEHWQVGLAELREGRNREAAWHFTRVLNAEGPSARVLFARGVARYRMKEFAQALEDLTEADRMGRDGKVKAALGICLVQPDADQARTNHHDAIRYYREAIRAGYGTARTYNNLGYSLAARGEFKEAREAFTKAIRRDPKLQAAYYNRAVLCLRGVRGKPESPTLAEAQDNRKRSQQLLRAALADIEKAIRLGPGTADLYRDAARLYAVAALLGLSDRNLPKRGVQHLAKAVDLGCALRELRGDPILRAGLGGGPQFDGILNRRGPGRPAGRIVRCPDPIE
jgi:tetratricopeptide (TPR) repeat protein